MSIRLQIAATILAGTFADGNRGYAEGMREKLALYHADTLIAIEEQTRKFSEPTQTDDSKLTADIITFIRDLNLKNATEVRISIVAQELIAILERNNARRQSWGKQQHQKI